MKSYFPRLLGNGDTKSRIGKAIENRTVPHAFLIGGPSGSGKSTFALELAAAINCLKKDEPSESLPCGKCDFCRRIYEGNFPDLKLLTKPKDRATLGVDAVKDFREDMFLSSTEAEHKIYVIDDAESMTVEAQNALLKVLEEPPPTVSIILLAKECDRILTTIKSRVQYIPMARFSDDELSKIILQSSPEARSVSLEDSERFRSIIMSSDGRIGAAKKLLSRKSADENDEQRADILRIISAIGPRAAYSDIYSAVVALPTKRQELSEALERLISAIRDLIVIKNDKNAKTVFFTSYEAAHKVGGDISLKRLFAIYDASSEALEMCSKNANIQNLLVNLSVRIKTRTVG